LKTVLTIDDLSDMLEALDVRDHLAAKAIKKAKD